jgi:hypothetical protein
MGYQRLKSRTIPRSHTLFLRRYGHTHTHTQHVFLFVSSAMLLCISPKLHALRRPDGKEKHRLALSYKIGIVMVDQAPKLRCMPSITEGLSDCFRRQNQPAEKEPPERNPGRTRIIDRAKRATVHLPLGLRSGRRAVSRSSVRQPRPVSFPCPLLPPLSFGEASSGEALLDVDELFSRISGSSNPTSLPSDQTDRSPTPLHSDQTDQSPVVQDHRLTPPPSDQTDQTDQTAETQGQQIQADEDREESVSQHPLEPASTASSSSGSLTHMVQPPLHRAQSNALLQSCIAELLAAPQRRRARERQMRRFDDGTRPAPLITAGLTNGGYSLFPYTRQRAGTAATPPTLRSQPEPEQPDQPEQPEQPERPERPEQSKAKARLDSAAIPTSETPQVPTLDPLGEENRDSGADVDDQYAPVVAGPSMDQNNANAPPLDRPESQIESVVKDPGSPLLDPPTIPLPSLPTPSTTTIRQPASQTLPLASPASAPSLRTSRPSRCRPFNFVRPQRSQASGLVAAASSSALRGDVEPVVDGPSSSSRIPPARSSPSPPPVSPCDRSRD